MAIYVLGILINTGRFYRIGKSLEKVNNFEAIILVMVSNSILKGTEVSREGRSITTCDTASQDSRLGGDRCEPMDRLRALTIWD